MQRKATKQSPAANADERRFMLWVKESPCCMCGCEGPSIADHSYGQTMRHNKVLIGHYALLPYCYECDQVKTIHGRKAHNDQFGITQAERWLDLIQDYPIPIPDEVVAAVRDWGR